MHSGGKLAQPIALIIQGAVMQKSSHSKSWSLMTAFDSLVDDVGIGEVELSGQQSRERVSLLVEL